MGCPISDIAMILLRILANFQIIMCIQLFRQSLSHESVEAYATMPIGSSCTLSLGITPLLPLLEVPATFLFSLITLEFTLCLLPGLVS